MSTIDDIRAAMARADGPVKPADIAESLDLEAKAVRNALYQAWTQGAGVEKYEDGTYGLIPGWKPRFGTADGAGVDAGDETPAAEEPAPERKPRGKRQDKAPRTKRASTPAAGKPGRKPKVQPAAADSMSAAPAGPAPDPDSITLRRSTVRTLLRFVLGARDLPNLVRDAALDIVREVL